MSWRSVGGLAVAGWLTGHGADLAPAPIWGEFTNGTARIELPRLPGIERMAVQVCESLASGFVDAPPGVVEGYTWKAPLSSPHAFYRVRMEPLDAGTVLGVVALNRLSYGPTPDLIERVLTGTNAIGPEAFIAEQLAPETINENLDAPLPPLDWQFASVTGVASSSTLYLYPSEAADLYVDDVTLVAGSVPESGPNLVRNGGFESALAGTWTVSSNLRNSTNTTAVRRTGERSLQLVATSGGTTRDSALWQVLAPALQEGRVYTLSYWYLPGTNTGNLTARLSQSGNYPGQGIDTTHGIVPGGHLPGLIHAKLSAEQARIADLRAWHMLHAVRSERQLMNVLLQFWDTHFNTQYAKTRDWLSGLVNDDEVPPVVATAFEFRELRRWRDVLLNPNGTFLDLLRISAESPAMIVYLDTVTSAGGNANENYSRELLELFAFGVDNGYDQSDIEQMSRAWTGWRVDKLPPGQENNPFANRVADRNLDPGVWTLRYRIDRHDNGAKTIFAGKTVPVRFGPPHAGQSYQLNLPARSGNAGMQDGYDIVQHLANLPFTREYISVKLCRLFVHEHFHHGLYDYTDPNRTEEARLVQACMAAWEQPGPDGRRGNLRQVLATIFASDLFRTRAALAQKVKTPFEYVVSTIRALRAARPDGGFTADTDGYDMISTLRRLNMSLFDRAEPDGWSEFGRDWVSTAAIVERLRFAQNFLIAAREPLKEVDFGDTGDDNVSDPAALLRLKLAEPAGRDAGAVADFFLALLFPSEGRFNLAPDRATAVAFLNAADSGVPDSSPFASLDPTTRAYDARVRGLVAMLMGLPRFQEQ